MNYCWGTRLKCRNLGTAKENSHHTILTNQEEREAKCKMKKGRGRGWFQRSFLLDFQTFLPVSLMDMQHLSVLLFYLPQDAQKARS